MLRRLGYWHSPERPDLPDPERLVDTAWSNDERELVAMYYRHATVARAYLGTASCRLCGASNGSTELSDGRYMWPEGLAHYIDAHSVRLPAEAERHALARMAELEHADVDEAWWLSATSA
jgi:hypothetical protein